ncbi:MAG TPA: glycosyl hydrolase [Deltaproteobacteria bacterium]|nr:glycosyl hydrolase [Deltaproteobacteria bacterium]
MASRDVRSIRAFDRSVIHAGNHALRIDHEKVERETDELLARMSPAQLRNEIRGSQARPIDGLFHAGGDASLGLAAWKMVDGPRGARAGTATAFPVAIARAATFDVLLERRVGMAIGLEVAARGGNVLLAPTINLLRHPGWGRAQETYSEDPHHTGAMAVAFVSGAQNHVLASPKHFALNNLENTRFELSSEIDPRSLHEVYLPHFKRCVVEAGAASVMSAYNKVNGVHCGENPELLDEILRRDWGFRGFVESDWFLGARSTAPSLNAGLDIEMPVGFRFSDEKLDEAIADGSLSEKTIARAARRSVYQKIAWQLTPDGVAGKDRPAPGVVECEEHVALAREAAEKSIVLLKNEGDVLPLERRAGTRIAVVGDLAIQANLGDRGSSMVTPSRVVTPLEGIETAAGACSIDFFGEGADLSRLDGYDVAIVVAGLTYRDEGEFIPTAQKDAEASDFAPGGDRERLDLPPGQRDLIEEALGRAARTVVVLQGGSAIVVRDWVDRVDGLLMAWYGGQAGGDALARVLFGEVSPSGRLPVSIPRDMADLMPWDVASLSVEHDLYPGYRWLDRYGCEAEFPFGFGLGYTEFTVGALEICRREGRFECRTLVRNEGSRDGATIVQLYVGYVDSKIERARQELKGFGRVELAAGASVELVIEVRDEDLRYYRTDTRSWALEECGYVFRIGQSSRDLPCQAVWRFEAGAWAAA